MTVFCRVLVTTEEGGVFGPRKYNMSESELCYKCRFGSVKYVKDIKNWGKAQPRITIDGEDIHSIYFSDGRIWDSELKDFRDSNSGVLKLMLEHYERQDNNDKDEDS